MEREIDIQLNKLKTKIIKMCSLVDEQVDFALRALLEQNKDLARLVIDRDKKVDKFDVKIEKICQKIFALNQPVAMDLRQIMTALTINNNLERIGDIAVNIAENFLIMDSLPDFYDKTHVPEMATIARDMLKNAIDSFIENNEELAKKVLATDDEMDKHNAENHKILINIMKEDKANIESAVAMLVISRQLERLADHTTNIAEDVYFIVEAQLIKHKYAKIILDQLEEDEENDD